MMPVNAVRKTASTEMIVDVTKFLRRVLPADLVVRSPRQLPFRGALSKKLGPWPPRPRLGRSPSQPRY